MGFTEHTQMRDVDRFFDCTTFSDHDVHCSIAVFYDFRFSIVEPLLLDTYLKSFHSPRVFTDERKSRRSITPLKLSLEVIEFKLTQNFHGKD